MEDEGIKTWIAYFIDNHLFEAHEQPPDINQLLATLPLQSFLLTSYFYEIL